MMMLQKRWKGIGVLGALVLWGGISSAVAGNLTVTGTVSQLRNGWGGEGYYFVLSNASGSSGCGSQFIIQKGFASYQEAVANAMLAYTLNSHVEINTDGTCANGAGNVIGVNLIP